jgi:outer membrane receptor protein involved in Fe transport
LRITGALRYSSASYEVRRADTPNAPNGTRLVNFDDNLYFSDFSGRIGAVVRAAKGLRFAFNYSRGFRYPKYDRPRNARLDRRRL